MKKQISILLVFAMLLSLGAAAFAEEEPKTVDIPSAGYHFVVPESYQKLKGDLNWYSMTMEDCDPGVRFVDLSYTAVTEDQMPAYNAFWDVFSEAILSNADAPEPADPRWTSEYLSGNIFTVFGIDGGRSRPELEAAVKAYFEPDRNSYAILEDLGRRGDTHFYLAQFVPTAEGDAARRETMGALYEEYAALRADRESFLNTLSLSEPQEPKEAAVGDLEAAPAEEALSRAELAPADASPVPTPVIEEAAPAEAVPVETAPAETAPVETTPAETAPAAPEGDWVAVPELGISMFLPRQLEELTGTLSLSVTTLSETDPVYELEFDYSGLPLARFDELYDAVIRQGKALPEEMSEYLRNNVRIFSVFCVGNSKDFDTLAEAYERYYDMPLQPEHVEKIALDEDRSFYLCRHYELDGKTLPDGVYADELRQVIANVDGIADSMEFQKPSLMIG